MKRDKIEISDNENITIPSEVNMTIAEIAELFGVFLQTVKREVRTIEKSGIASGDDSSSCIVDGKNIYPSYYGLDMIIALAFRVQSFKVDVFRKWVIKKTARNSVTTTLILPMLRCLIKVVVLFQGQQAGISNCEGGME